MNRHDYSLIPDYTLRALKGWVTEAKPTGGFLRSVLRNDLKRAVGAADNVNLAALPQIVCFIFNHIPQACWGSPSKVVFWPERLEEFRAKGLDIDGFWKHGK